MVKKYEARNGSPFSSKLAQRYGERLETLSSMNKGKITPTMVVDDARQSKSSPFNDYFEWDDNEAAEQYRLHQARQLINHIIEVVVIEGKPSKHRSFFSVRNGGGKLAYVNLRTAITKTSYRTQLLNQLITLMENSTELMKLFRSHERK